MNKISLVSFPRYFNYGTQLQLFALQTVIEQLGYVCEVVDYHREFETDNPRVELRQRKLQRIKSLICDPMKVFRHRPIKCYQRLFSDLTGKRNALYQAFLDDYIHLGRRGYCSYHELAQDPPACDAFVVGSDQVWNPISHFQDSSYYLAFAEPAQRIAYAPSIGMSEIPENARAWMREGIDGIPHLSVREQKGVELIKELTGRDAKVVLDPTLLLSIADWKELSVPPSPNTGPYVLCYVLEGDRYIRDHAAKIARENNCALVVIPVHQFDVEDSMHEMQKKYDVGPREFLGLFHNASCICTDSFHGTVFSILFRRPFFTFRRYANGKQAALHSRITNILEVTGLQSREMTRGVALPNQPLEINYDGVEERLETMRQDSVNFLRQALMEATR